MFDSSVTRGSPVVFPLDRVIAGWTEALQLMTVGEKARFWIPGNLAYGEEDTGTGPCPYPLRRKRGFPESKIVLFRPPS